MKKLSIYCFLFTLLLTVTLLSFTEKKDELEESISRGKEVYTSFCVSCHQPEGEGLSAAFPPLAKSDFLMADKKRSIKVVLFGMGGPVTVNGAEYNSYMASLGLEDQQVADVLNYIRNSWGNKGDAVTQDEVKITREAGE